MMTARKATPISILDDLLGGAAPIVPATHTAVASTTTTPAPVATADPAHSSWSALSPTLYRLAGRLQTLADERGVLWLADADAGEVFGTASERTQANQLSSLKRAGVISYSRDAGWFVRFLVVQSRTNSVQIRTDSVQSRTTGNGDGRAIPHDIRANSHDDQNGAVQSRTTPVQSRTDIVQIRTDSVQSRTISTTTNNTDCLIVDPAIPDTNQSITPAPEPPFVPDPVEAHTAKRLLTDIGVIPVTADLIVAQRSLFDVRRVVGYAWSNRREVGGNLDNWLGFVVKALNFPQRHGIPATISQNFLYSELHRQHLTPAELAEYAAVQEEPEPPPLTRIRDDDAQVEPSDDGPTGFDPARTWAEFAVAHNGFEGTKLLAYDPATGEATVSAPSVKALDWLKTRGVFVARKQTPARFGRPVFVNFEEMQP